MGHFYGALAIMVISTLIFKEVIVLKRKEYYQKTVFFNWAEWYFFFLVFYFLLPHLFLRRDLIKDIHFLSAF
jgi:hypothetical protein